MPSGCGPGIACSLLDLVGSEVTVGLLRILMRAWASVGVRRLEAVAVVVDPLKRRGC